MNLDNLSGPVGHERRADQSNRSYETLAFSGLRVGIDYNFDALPNWDGDRLTLRAQDADTFLAVPGLARNAGRNPQRPELRHQVIEGGDIAFVCVGENRRVLLEGVSTPISARTSPNPFACFPSTTPAYRDDRGRKRLGGPGYVHVGGLVEQPGKVRRGPGPVDYLASRESAIAEAIPRRRSDSIEGMSAISSTRIRNWPVILLGSRLVSSNAAAVCDAAASAAFGPAGGAVVSAG